MKHLTLASKFIAVLCMALILTACAGQKKEEEAAAAREAAAAEAAAREAEQQRAEEERRRRAAEREEAAEERRLEQAAREAGNTFYFAFDSSTLGEETQDKLDAHIAWLETNQKNIRLEGHADERGTREYNMALGERRANSVRDYMVVNGIPSYRIETISYGEEKPVAYGSNESAWSQNRRVEIKY